MSKAKIWSWLPDPVTPGDRLFDIGLSANGDLYNPRRYDPALVRLAIDRVLERKAQKRKARARAARERRGGLGIKEIAERFLRRLRAPEAPGSVAVKELAERYGISEVAAARIVEDFAAKWETPAPNADDAHGKARR